MIQDVNGIEVLVVIDVPMLVLVSVDKSQKHVEPIAFLRALRGAPTSLDLLKRGSVILLTPNRSNIHRTTPIRLTQTPARCRVIPVAGIKLGIGRRPCVASDAEQRTEGVERVEAPVEPKREFVEVGL